MIAAGWAPPRAHRPGLRANMGGPMSRTRTETIVSSLLGRGDGTIRCPCVLRIGLSFESAVCVDVIERLLDEAGFADPEELRARFPHPDRRLACRPLPADVGRVSVARGARPTRWGVRCPSRARACAYRPSGCIRRRRRRDAPCPGTT